MPDGRPASWRERRSAARRSRRPSAASARWFRTRHILLSGLRPSGLPGEYGWPPAPAQAPVGRAVHGHVEKHGGADMVHVVSPDEGEVIQVGPIRLRIIE